MNPPPPLELLFPLPRTHCGVALGNGAFGALVWGTDDLHLTVSRNDHWDHRHGVVYPAGVSYRDLLTQYDPDDPVKLKGAIGAHLTAPPFPTSMLPGGRFDLRLADGLRPDVARLHFGDGRLEVVLRAGDGPAQRLWLQLSPTEDQLYLDDPGGCIVDLTARPAWDWVGGQRPEGEARSASLTGRGFEPPHCFSEPDRAAGSSRLPRTPVSMPPPCASTAAD